MRMSTLLTDRSRSCDGTIPSAQAQHLIYQATSKGLRPRQVLVCVIFLLAALTRCADHPVKIVFVPGGASHGYGMHEHRAGLLLLARSMEQQWPRLETVVTEADSWPAPDVLADANALVMACEGSRHVVLPHLEQVEALAERGLGIALIHYAVDPPAGPASDAVKRWIGGVYERGWSINPDWAAEFTDFPDHPAANGLQPFSVYDEWYFNLRFVPGREGVTPILEARPPLSTLLRKDGPSSNNLDVRKSVLRGDRQVLSWVYDRPGGGRGFGFTGAHHHHNYRDDNFRKTVLNGVAWVAGLEVPSGGVESTTPSWEEIAAHQDYEKPPAWEQEAGLEMSGAADPVYSTPPVAAHAKQPFPVEVVIPPNRYRHIYLVFKAGSAVESNGNASGVIGLHNVRFRGETGNEAPLHQETPAHFIGQDGPRELPAHWTEPDTAMEIPAPSLVHYPVPRGATHFLAGLSFRREDAPGRQAKSHARLHVFFAPPPLRHFRKSSPPAAQ